MKKWAVIVLCVIFSTGMAAVTLAEVDSEITAEEISPSSGITADEEGMDVGKDEADGGDPKRWKVADSAKAVLVGTGPDMEIQGTVEYVQSGEGVQVVASLSGVTPPGMHGFHIHENGSCDDMGKAAGGHFNPAGAEHGFLPGDGREKSHLGDMGNIEIDDEGNGSLVLYMPGLSLSEGDSNISGKAVILHAKEDDFGQPTGNAGGRIACGIIEPN